MQAISWIDIFEKYPGKWVVLREDHKTVITASKEAEVAYRKAKEKGVKVPFLFKVPVESWPYVGGFAPIK